jgi:hypothetical protein
MPKLEILSGKREGDVVDLSNEGVDIGNRKTAKLSIRDPWISWNHAKIVFEDGRFVIEDMGSSNGTCVNGKKVTRQPLVPSDEIMLGKTRIRFVEAGGADGGDHDGPSETMRISRNEAASGSGFVGGDAAERIAELEREKSELMKMKEVLERFLDLSPDERKALARSAPSTERIVIAPAEVADTSGAEKARQEAVAKLIELEGKLTAAEVRAVDAENRVKASSEDKKKELAKLKTRHEEETQTLRLEKVEAEAARARAEEKAEELAKKVESAAAEANARADKLAKELETARKSGIDADARATKLEMKLDEARRATGRMSASGAAANPELDALKMELQQVRAERDEWKRKHDDTREEIDRISMEQIELEDSLRKRIAELEGK